MAYNHLSDNLSLFHLGPPLWWPFAIQLIILLDCPFKPHHGTLFWSFWPFFVWPLDLLRTIDYSISCLLIIPDTVHSWSDISLAWTHLKYLTVIGLSLFDVQYRGTIYAADHTLATLCSEVCRNVALLHVIFHSLKHILFFFFFEVYFFDICVYIL